jgi:hypothetical protein
MHVYSSGVIRELKFYVAFPSVIFWFPPTIELFKAPIVFCLIDCATWVFKKKSQLSVSFSKFRVLGLSVTLVVCGEK